MRVKYIKLLKVIGLFFITFLIIDMVRRRGTRRKTRKRENFQSGGSSGKKIAILLRGKHHNKCKKSFEEMVYKPLVNAGNTVDVYIITYHLQDDTKLQNYPNVKKIEFANETNNQVQTYIQGLKMIPDSYDLYIALRFDLLYKKPFTNFLPLYSPDEEKVWVAWREYENLWKQHNRVADTIHIFTKQSRRNFQKVLESGQFSSDMHMLYNPLIQTTQIDFLVPGFYDSNPSKGLAPEMKNPIYIFSNRGYSHNDKPPENACN